MDVSTGLIDRGFGRRAAVLLAFVELLIMGWKAALAAAGFCMVVANFAARFCMGWKATLVAVDLWMV